MRVFAFDVDEAGRRYAEQGWVHVPAGIDPGFLAELQAFVARSLAEHRVEGRAIGGTKEQSLFEFPEGVDFPGELFDVVAAVCGLRRETMTLSERHIKVYDADAPPDPPAHKDRLASQVSVGLSIDIPAESRLVLYPHEHRELNPFNISAALRRSLEPDQLPEAILRDAEEVEVDDAGGDVVMFPGNSMWHLRRKAARAINLYLKFNDFGSDPLGEDPATPARRERTLALLDDDGGLAAEIPVLGRRLDTVARRYVRDGWQELVEAHVWDDEPFAIDERELELLRAADGRRTWSELAADGAEQPLRRLARRGALDLVPRNGD
jgi:hypothetical protein